jgi:hypothetical protein
MLEAGKPSIKTDDIQQVSTIPEKRNLKTKIRRGTLESGEKEGTGRQSLQRS